MPWILCLGFAGCTAPHPSANLESVERPIDFDQLDLAVRKQFDELWDDLQAAESATPMEAGATWGKLGQWFDLYQHPDVAARCYRNAGQLQPAEARWPYYLGRLAEDAGSLDVAAADYAASAALAPEADGPKLRLGDLALLRQDLDTAESTYRELLARDPRQPGALFGMAQLDLLRGEAAAAISRLRILAESQPEAVQVQYSLGLAWRRLGDDETAAEHFARVPAENLDQILLDRGLEWDTEVLRMDRGARGFTRRAVRAAHRGEREAAARLFRAAVLADPNGSQNHINLAVVLAQMGRWAGAAQELQTALQLTDEGSDHAAKAHLEMGRLLIAHGRPAAAVPHLQATLTVDPRLVPALVQLGKAFHLLGRLDESLAQFAAARDLDGAGAEVRFWHAVLLILLDRHHEAQQALQEDLRTLGGEPKLLLLAARLYAAAPEDAERDTAGAGRLLAGVGGPPSVLYAETAAMVAAQTGRFDEAESWQRAAIHALAEDGPRKAAQTARRRLALYEQHAPCRTPWELWEVPVQSVVEGSPAEPPT